MNNFQRFVGACLPLHHVLASYAPDRSTSLRFIAIFASVRKDEEEEKKTKKNETLAAHISEMA